MNRFLITVIVAWALGAPPLWAGDHSAAPDDERLPGAAPWESLAEADIWSHAAETGGMAVNAFCSAGAITRAGELRREARAALELELASETGTDRSRFLALVLEHATERAVATESADDRELIGRVRYSRGMSHLPDPGVASAGEGGGRVCAIVWICAPAPAGHSYHTKKSATGKYSGYNARIPTGVNLVDYSFDTVMFDAWRLYLYLWDDIPTGVKKTINLSGLHSPSSTVTFRPSSRNFEKTEHSDTTTMFRMCGNLTLCVIRIPCRPMRPLNPPEGDLIIGSDHIHPLRGTGGRHQLRWKYVACHFSRSPMHLSGLTLAIDIQTALIIDAAHHHTLQGAPA